MFLEKINAESIYKSDNVLISVFGLFLALFLLCLGFTILFWFVLGLIFGDVVWNWFSIMAIVSWTFFGFFAAFRGLLHIVNLVRSVAQKNLTQKIIFFSIFAIFSFITLLFLSFLLWYGWGIFSIEKTLNIM